VITIEILTGEQLLIAGRETGGLSRAAFSSGMIPAVLIVDMASLEMKKAELMSVFAITADSSMV
jgi:hypothetical protein